MGYEVSPKFYTKECNNIKVLSYLNRHGEYEYSSRSFPEGFYDLCRKYGKQYTDSEINIAHTCWVFDDQVKMFEFAAQPECPSWLADYITENYSEEEPVLIIWYY